MDARQFGEGGGPVHVAVAHQDELRVDSLRKERFGEGFVEFGHARDILGCDSLGGGPPVALLMGLLPPLQQLGFGTSPRGSKETLHQACAQAEGGIIFFLAAQKSAPGRAVKIAALHKQCG
jgi:hypothetical protein